MTDLVQQLRDSATQARAIDRAALLHAAADEIERLRLQPCPYVAGEVTRYCTLTPFTLTDAEREAVEVACQDLRHTEEAATLRGLLERIEGK